MEQIGRPVLYEKRRSWLEGDISIEPGEEHQETFQFIVSRSVESVVALTVVNNPRHSKGSRNRAEAWRCYTFHDMLSAHRWNANL